MKKIFSLLSKSHKKVSSKPCKAGLGSISLDNNYTRKYNCNNDETHNFHLCSFRSIDYLPRGCRLVASTCSCEANSRSKNTPQQFKKSALIAILSLSLLLNFAFGAGIPVVDAAANAQISTQNAKQIAEWAKEASRWSDTVSSKLSSLL